MKIGYARVSTDEQTTNSQQDALSRAGCEAIYIETGSGKTIDGRPIISALLKRLDRGDTLVVTRLDRLARSVKELLELMDHFKATGAHLVSLQEQINTSTANGKLIFHMFAVIAEFERNLIVERTHAGLAASRRRGVQGGRPPLNADIVRAIKREANNLQLDVGRFCREHRISRTTFYKYQHVATQADAKASKGKGKPKAAPLSADVVQLMPRPTTRLNHDTTPTTARRTRKNNSTRRAAV